MTPQPTGSSARADWEQRIYRRTESGESAGISLEPPGDLVATPGQGQVSLTWSPVPEASGYVVSRADCPDGEFVALEHGNSDVEPVPETGTPTASSSPAAATPGACRPCPRSASRPAPPARW